MPHRHAPNQAADGSPQRPRTCGTKPRVTPAPGAPTTIDAEATLHVARARCHHRGQRDAGVAAARICPRHGHRGAARRRRLLRRVLCGPADHQFLPPTAGRGRAQRGLRAAVAADQADRGRELAPIASSSRCSAPCCSWSASLAAGALWFAPALIGLLAPGFDGERHALAAEYLRIVAPYVALAGIVAVLAAALNAQGRMVAAGLGTVAFNVVLLLALASIAGFGVTQPSAVGAILALCHRARRDRAAGGDRRRLSALRRSTGSAGKTATGSRREAPRWFRGAFAFPPMRGASSCSPFPASSLPAFRN